MKTPGNLFPLAATLAVVVTGVLATPTRAFTINRNSNPDKLLKVLLGDTTGLSNFDVTVRGDDRAFGIFKDDPFDLGSGIVLSTGKVTQIDGRNKADNEFTNGVDLNSGLSGYDRPETDLYDITTLKISFDVDQTVKKLFFEYVFGSEEFPEYAGSQFNDFFNLELNGKNLALLNDSVGKSEVVSVNNLAASPGGKFSKDYIENPVGSKETRLDGYTKPLTFKGKLKQGERNTLKILIADVADDRLDSAVFIKAETLGTTQPGTIPVPPPQPPVPEPPAPEPEPPAPPEDSVIPPDPVFPPDPDPEIELPPEAGEDVPTVIIPDADEPETTSVPEPGLLAGLLLVGAMGWRGRSRANPSHD